MFQSKQRKNRIIQHIEFVALSTIACGIGYLVSRQDDINSATIIICTGVIVALVIVGVYCTGGENGE